MDNDEFHPKMCKHIGPKFMRLLLQLYNECWQKSNWPWFKARILFIRKPNKESYLLCSSFRPLSISSHNDKLFERVVEQRLMKWLEASNCINLTQDGFRTKKSTARSLYRLNPLIEKTIRKRKSAAKHPHGESVQKRLNEWNDLQIERKWSGGKTTCRLTHFPENRIAFIRIDKHDNSEFKVKTGLAQGRVLSAVLFILHIDKFF